MSRSDSESASQIVLARHGATEWSTNGRHTGRTDLPLLDAGRAEAAALKDRLATRSFALVLASPLQRARETARLAGFGDEAVVDDDLREWDYGDYEGLTTDEIRQTRPGWTVWSGDCPNGESAGAVGVRADRVIARAVAARGPVVLFSHGHFLRVLTARWLDLSAVEGARFILRTGTLSVLGYERETRAIDRWNA